MYGQFFAQVRRKGQVVQQCQGRNMILDVGLAVLTAQLDERLYADDEFSLLLGDGAAASSPEQVGLQGTTISQVWAFSGWDSYLNGTANAVSMSALSVLPAPSLDSPEILIPAYSHLKRFEAEIWSAADATFAEGVIQRGLSPVNFARVVMPGILIENGDDFTFLWYLSMGF